MNKVVSINPYTNVMIEGTENKLNYTKTAKFNATTFFTSFLSISDFMTTEVSISSNIPEEDRIDALDIKVYEDLALEQDLEYTIEYFETTDPSVEKDRTFLAFVVNPENLEERFNELADKVKYIDTILPSTLLIEQIYKKEILESTEIDCYLYFQSGDSFLSIYKDGKYLYSKALKYSFAEMADKYSDMSGESVNEDEFIKILMSDGLKSMDISIQKYVMKIFNEAFIYINDILIYAKRSYDIEDINKIYIGSEFGTIDGINEYAETYLGLAAFDFDFDYGISGSGSDRVTDQLQYLMQLAGWDYIATEPEIPNFTLYKRPPPFTKRPTGQLIVTFVGVSVLAIAYPIYNFGYGGYNKVMNMSATSDLEELRPIANDLKGRIARLQKDIESAKVVKVQEEDLFNTRMNILENMYNKKVNYPMKSNIISELTKDLNKFNVLVSNIMQKGKVIHLSLVSKEESAITELIKYIIHKKYEKFSVTTDLVYKDSEYNNQYTSLIKVIAK